MKLLKKMSTFVVALTFLFVFSIKANAAETYKVGDKVLFGDFGGHVIEDSDSNSNTVKVFVDGWNKTKEQWESYWKKTIENGLNMNDSTISEINKLIEEGRNLTYERNNKITTSCGTSSSDEDLKCRSNIYEEYSRIDDINKQLKKITTYIDDVVNSTYKEQVKNLLNFNMENAHIDLIKKYATLTEKETGYNITNSKYDWLINPNFYGKVDVEYNGWSFQGQSYDDIFGQIMLMHGKYVGAFKSSDDGKDYWGFGIKVSYEVDIDEGKNISLNPVAISSYKDSFSSAIYYQIVTLDKSNLTKIVDKCDDYSDSYKITYETNGGDKIDAVSVTGNKELTTPKRDGYIFDGWYTDSNFTTKVSSITPTQKMKDRCLAGYNDVTVYAKWKKELTSDKVSILGEEKTLENVSSIAVKLLDKVTANIVGTLKTFTAYDITLKDASGKSVEPSGKVKLSLEIPKDYDKNNIGIYRVDGKKLIPYETKINGEYAEIETDHFSTYIVGEKAEVKEEEKTTTKVTNETLSKDDSNIQNPKTGDNMIIFFIVGILLVGGIAIVLKKLKTVK